MYEKYVKILSPLLEYWSDVFSISTDINKGSPVDYKSGSACSTPTKETLKGYDRNCIGPVLPPRSVMGSMPSHHHYSAPMNFRKGILAHCSSRCIAIVSISIVILLIVLFLLLTGKLFAYWWLLLKNIYIQDKFPISLKIDLLTNRLFISKEHLSGVIRKAQLHFSVCRCQFNHQWNSNKVMNQNIRHNKVAIIIFEKTLL